MDRYTYNCEACERGLSHEAFEDLTLIYAAIRDAAIQTGTHSYAEGVGDDEFTIYLDRHGREYSVRVEPIG